MANRITIIGSTGSGKTTYMTGMYAYMSGFGCKGFSLSTDTDSDLRLIGMWENLESGKFPVASADSEEYNFHIAHNISSPVCDFAWLDYPGGLLMDPSHDKYQQMTDSIAQSDCLLFVVDAGSVFAFDAEDAEDYRSRLGRKLMMNSSIRSEAMQLSALARKGVRIPPVCLTITKADLINPEYAPVIEEVLRECFEALFMGSPRVIISAVSLGRDIETEGADPHCIEEPIVFAVLNILCKYIEQLSIRRNERLKIVNKNRSFFSELFNREEIAKAKQELEELEKRGDAWIRDAKNLTGLIREGKSIYVGGRREDFHQYFRQIFDEIMD